MVSITALVWRIWRYLGDAYRSVRVQIGKGKKHITLTFIRAELSSPYDEWRRKYQVGIHVETFRGAYLYYDAAHPNTISLLNMYLINKAKRWQKKEQNELPI